MNWYDTDSWYAPLEQKQAPAEPFQAEAPVTPARSRKKRLWFSLTAFLLVAALVLGLCLPAMLHKDQRAAASQAPFTENPFQQSPERDGSPAPTEQPGEDKGFNHSADGAEKPDTEDGDEEFPEQWSDFFENYYQETDSSSAVVNIERTEGNDTFAIRLQEAGKTELSLQVLYDKCAPSIVAISGYTKGVQGYNWGTGVVLTADGLILTNTHVIDACDRATVTLFNDQEYEAKLVGFDTFSDLAVLKIDAKGLKPAEFGDSSSLRVGDPVAAIGNPLGDTFRCTLTDGIISAISRDISYKGRTMTLLQTNTALNEGNSGGALFNMYGQVVGITNMKMMSSYSSIEGIGFAIPSVTVREVVSGLVRFGEFRGRPSIGITVGAIPEEAESRYQLPKGLYITDVQKNSDAWVKGVRPGDILMEVNHIQVLTTADVSEIKNQFSVGDSLHFTIWRNGETLEFDVLLMDNNDLYGG